MTQFARSEVSEEVKRIESVETRMLKAEIPALASRAARQQRKAYLGACLRKARGDKPAKQFASPAIVSRVEAGIFSDWVEAYLSDPDVVRALAFMVLACDANVEIKTIVSVKQEVA